MYGGDGAFEEDVDEVDEDGGFGGGYWGWGWVRLENEREWGLDVKEGSEDLAATGLRWWGGS